MEPRELWPVGSVVAAHGTGGQTCAPVQAAPQALGREARLHLLLQPHSLSARQPRQPGPAAPLLDGLR